MGNKEGDCKTKKNVIIIVLLCVVVLIFCVFFFGGVVHYLNRFSTHYKYDDTWVIGRHVTEIEERYGEFDFGEYEVGKQDRVGYLVEDNLPVMHNPVPSYYYMEYDKDGIVTKVYIALHPGG